MRANCKKGTFGLQKSAISTSPLISQYETFSVSMNESLVNKHRPCFFPFFSLLFLRHAYEVGGRRRGKRTWRRKRDRDDSSLLLLFLPLPFVHAKDRTESQIEFLTAFFVFVSPPSRLLVLYNSLSQIKDSIPRFGWCKGGRMWSFGEGKLGRGEELSQF